MSATTDEITRDIKDVFGGNEGDLLFFGRNIRRSGQPVRAAKTPGAGRPAFQNIGKSQRRYWWNEFRARKRLHFWARFARSRVNGIYLGTAWRFLAVMLNVWGTTLVQHWWKLQPLLPESVSSSSVENTSLQTAFNNVEAASKSRTS
jgi:hypothetical protein